MDLKTGVKDQSSIVVKNYIGKHTQHFSWMLRFPKSIQIKNIPKRDILILNDKFKRFDSSFEYNEKENYIIIVPKNDYEMNRDYFLLIDHYIEQGKPKDFCIAFHLSGNNEIKTFDTKTSIDKLNFANKKMKLSDDADKTQEEIKKPVIPKEYLAKLNYKLNFIFLYISVISVLIEFFIENFINPFFKLSQYTVVPAVLIVILCSFIQIGVSIIQLSSDKFKSYRIYNQAVGLYNSNEYEQAFSLFRQSYEIHEKNVAASKATEACEKQLGLFNRFINASHSTWLLEPLDYQYNMVPFTISGIFNFFHCLFVHILRTDWPLSRYLWGVFWACNILQVVFFIIQFFGSAKKSTHIYNKGVEKFNLGYFVEAKEIFNHALLVNADNLSAKAAIEIVETKIK